MSIDADAAATAGESLRGRVAGDDGPAMVALLRIERSPAGTFAFQIDSHRVAVRDGTAPFELQVPGWLPPEATGRGCRLHYTVRVDWQPSRWSHREALRTVAICPAEREVHEGRNRLDRLIPSQPGRHFHLELVDAVLEGGGHLAGRVHRDAGSDDTAFVVTASCTEVWCTNFRFRSRRAPLLWEMVQLWSTSSHLSLDPDDHWGPFQFDIPDGLPAATEGRVIAWRYSIEARSETRRAFASHAVLTPLRFEI
jgi:hypothetical protein